MKVIIGWLGGVGFTPNSFIVVEYEIRGVLGISEGENTNLSLGCLVALMALNGEVTKNGSEGLTLLTHPANVEPCRYLA